MRVTVNPNGPISVSVRGSGPTVNTTVSGAIPDDILTTRLGPDGPVNVSVRTTEEVLNASIVGAGPAGPKGDTGATGPTGPAGAAGIQTISSAQDVDISQLTDGALLIFSTDSGKWTAGSMLEDQYIEGGHF